MQKVPKEFRRRRSYHRHSIVENPKWMMQYSETEQDNMPDMSSSASLVGNRQKVLSPSNSEDRPEVRESYRSSLKHGSNPGNTQQQQQQPASSYNSQFDWKRWYREKVDSDDD